MGFAELQKKAAENLFVDNPPMLGRMAGDDPVIDLDDCADLDTRASTKAIVDVKVGFASGQEGRAIVSLFQSNDDEDRGGYVFRFTMDDHSGGSFFPYSRLIKDGVELHFAGDAEAASFFVALQELLRFVEKPYSRGGIFEVAVTRRY